MKKPIILNALITALALPVIGIAQDKTPPSPVPPPSPDGVLRDPAASRMQFSGPITDVNPGQKTVTINDAKMGAHTLHIGDTTSLKHGDRDGTWDDLKVGAKINGVCLGGKKKAHAVTITIHE